MVRLTRPITALALLVLAGCGEPVPLAEPVSTSQVADAAAPTPSAASSVVTATPLGTVCWATEVTPAIYEEVPGQVQVVQAQVDETGTVTQPPIYRNASVPRLVTPRGEVRFQAPCPDAVTPAFLAALQRALFARGYYQGAINGQMDAATRSAVHKYQLEQGLDSAQLSLETARAFGLAAIPRDAARDPG